MTTHIIQDVQVGPPGSIFTTRGFFPECLLTKTVSIEDFPDATVTANEFRIGAELVRRDVNMALKSKALFDLQAKEI